jgi:diguanylate cyclase (GGDEF)-like protein
MPIYPEAATTATVSTITGCAGFLDTLDNALISASNLNRRMGILFIDLSHVNMLTTRLGYRKVSEILDGVHSILADIKRPSDLLERIDETRFALILPDIKFPAVIDLAVNKVHESLDGLRSLTGLETTIYPKTGIALYPEHGKSAEELLLEADTAAQAAHISGTHVMRAGSDECQKINQSKLIESEFESAFMNSEFELHYQPKVAIASREIYGAEALIRWKHKDLGSINPEMLVQVIERGPLLQDVTLWTLNTALNQSNAMRKKYPGFKIAVNLSPGLLTSPDLVELVLQSLKTWEVPHDSLILEVTETAMIADQASAIDNLQKLSEAGVIMSIDDFGTGYSSYSYLQQFPVNELKIDKSFIQSLLTDASSEKLVGSMITLGKDFGLGVLAEGIETVEVLDRLVELGCEYGQGYLISRPMPIEDMIKWLDKPDW